MRMEIPRRRLTCYIWLDVRLLIVGPYYWLRRTMRPVWISASLALLVPNEVTRTGGLLVRSNCVMALEWVPWSLDFAKAVILMLSARCRRLVRLGMNEVNRANIIMVRPLLTTREYKLIS